jgi:Relaxase/Mobilisation nuclease domain
MAIIKCLSAKSNVGNILGYVRDREKTEDKIISGINCNPETAKEEMTFTKEFHGKKEGRQYYHVIQSFKPGEVEPIKAHEIGKAFASAKFENYEVVVCTHTDKDHVHNHIIVNSVNKETGKMYHSTKQDLRELKHENDRICEREGLSVPEPNKNRYMTMKELQPAMKGESWKFKLMTEIDHAKSISHTKDEFLENMKSRGHEVSWTDSRKYITYTTPEGMKCRDSKLPAEYSKETMEHEFKRPQRQEQTARTEQARSYISRDHERNSKKSSKDLDRGDDRTAEHRNAGLSSREDARHEQRTESRDNKELGEVQQWENRDNEHSDGLRERSRGNEQESSHGDQSDRGGSERNSESSENRGQGDKREDRGFGKSISSGESLLEAIIDIARNSFRAVDISGDQRDKVKSDKKNLERDVKEHEIKEGHVRERDRGRGR